MPDFLKGGPSSASGSSGDNSFIGPEGKPDATQGGAPAGSPYTIEALTSPNGFAGMDGLFRLRPDGRTERGLAVLEIQREKIVVVDPAPQSFEATVN